MSEHYFLLGNGRVPDHVAEAVDAVAARHDAHLCRHDDPATGWRYWLACDNRGAPFDGRTARAVVDDLDAAGLLDGDALNLDMTPDEVRATPIDGAPLDGDAFERDYPPSVRDAMVYIVSAGGPAPDDHPAAEVEVAETAAHLLTVGSRDGSYGYRVDAAKRARQLLADNPALRRSLKEALA